MRGAHPKRLFTLHLPADTGTGLWSPEVLRTVHGRHCQAAAGVAPRAGAGLQGGLAVVSNQENRGAGVLGRIPEEDGMTGASREVPGTQEPGSAILPTGKCFWF